MFYHWDSNRIRPIHPEERMKKQEYEPIMCDGVNYRCKLCGESLLMKVCYHNTQEGTTWCLCHGKEAGKVNG